MTPLTRPPRLAPGGTIGVAAISGPVEPDRLSAGVRSLERRGYRVVLAGNAGSRRGFLAGSDAERAEGYRGLLADPAVDAIFFARGGYGASRTLAHLDPEEIRARPRIHLGGSDVTALFAFLARRCGLASFYGPMVAVSMAEEEGLDWEAVLAGATPEPHRLGEPDIQAGGTGEGPLAGGCLSLLATLCGTPEAVEGRGAVLFWEDVAEDTYRLDRMLTQLERSGTFDGLQAMVIGSISPGERGGESPETVGAWLRDYFAGSPFPVVSGFPAGHLARTRTLPLGLTVRVDADGGRITFSGPAVAGEPAWRP
ncbi:MAG TPA: LD-carboxypeptidase [Thermoanaerobaculia bacterium]|jgi:muramoyltetrapeptide carboxypeptidase|nr:LD-carboxypeptidase [Thermoanaerobaculia bacterium]